MTGTNTIEGVSVIMFVRATPTTVSVYGFGHFVFSYSLKKERLRSDTLCNAGADNKTTVVVSVQPTTGNTRNGLYQSSPP